MAVKKKAARKTVVKRATKKSAKRKKTRGDGNACTGSCVYINGVLDQSDCSTGCSCPPGGGLQEDVIEIVSCTTSFKGKGKSARNAKFKREKPAKLFKEGGKRKIHIFLVEK